MFTVSLGMTQLICFRSNFVATSWSFLPDAASSSILFVFLKRYELTDFYLYKLTKRLYSSLDTLKIFQDETRAVAWNLCAAFYPILHLKLFLTGSVLYFFLCSALPAKIQMFIEKLKVIETFKWVLFTFNNVNGKIDLVRCKLHFLPYRWNEFAFQYQDMWPCLCGLKLLQHRRSQRQCFFEVGQLLSLHEIGILLSHEEVHSFLVYLILSHPVAIEVYRPQYYAPTHKTKFRFWFGYNLFVYQR